jgi:DNA-binding NarL/FixJ family response regulator
MFLPLPILAIGKHPQILRTVVGLLNKNPAWQGHGAEDVASALQKLKEVHPALVLLTNGLSEVEEAEITQHAIKLHPGPIVIQHYGGGSGLLENEIRAALEGH